MPPKKRSAKKSSEQTADNSWLTQFCLENDIPVSLMEVLADHHITSESILAKITEQDLVDMKVAVGHKIKPNQLHIRRWPPRCQP